MTDLTASDRRILAVASALAEDGVREFIELTHEGTPWGDLPADRKWKAVQSQIPRAKLAVETADGVVLDRYLRHPALLLLRDQIDTADEKGYTPEHDREHGAGPLIRAAKAYMIEVATRLSCGIEGDGVYLWPFKDGWNPDPDPAVTLAKAAQLLLAAADVIPAERAVGGAW